MYIFVVVVVAKLWKLMTRKKILQTNQTQEQFSFDRWAKKGKSFEWNLNFTREIFDKK